MSLPPSSAHLATHCSGVRAVADVDNLMQPRTGCRLYPGAVQEEESAVKSKFCMLQKILTLANTKLTVSAKPRRFVSHSDNSNVSERN